MLQNQCSDCVLGGEDINLLSSQKWTDILHFFLLNMELCALWLQVKEHWVIEATHGKQYNIFNITIF